MRFHTNTTHALAFSYLEQQRYFLNARHPIDFLAIPTIRGHIHIFDAVWDSFVPFAFNEDDLRLLYYEAVTSHDVNMFERVHSILFDHNHFISIDTKTITAAFHGQCPHDITAKIISQIQLSDILQPSPSPPHFSLAINYGVYSRDHLRSVSKEDIDWHMVDADGMTILHHAAMSSDATIISDLISLMSPSKQLLNSVIMSCIETACDHVIRSLFLAGADLTCLVSARLGVKQRCDLCEPFNPCRTPIRRLTPLHLGIIYSTYNSIHIVNDSEAHVNAADSSGLTPLHYSVRNNDLAALEYLLTNKSMSLIPDKMGMTPLLLSAVLGHKEIESRLIESFPGHHDLPYLIYKGDLPPESKFIAELLLDYNPDAFLSSDAPMAHKALSSGIFRNHLLNNACFYQCLKCAIATDQAGIVERLLQHSRILDSHRLLFEGEPILHFAAANGSLGVIHWCVSNGTGIDTLNAAGWSATGVACWSHKVPAVECLIGLGADPTVGVVSPLRLAIERGCEEAALVILNCKGFLDLWESHSVTILSTAITHRMSTVSSRLFDIVDMDIIDIDGNTIIHAAVESESDELLRIACAVNPSVLNSPNYYGKTPLLMATWRSSDLAMTLIELGANISISDFQGNTPLHVALLCGNEQLARHLIVSGADLNARTLDGRSPAECWPDGIAAPTWL